MKANEPPLRVEVKASSRRYEIQIGSGVLQSLGEIARAHSPGRRAVVITDSVVGPLYAERALDSLRHAGFNALAATAPAGESAKTLRHASQLFDVLVEHSMDRNTLIVALGGGVVGDLAGFVAATFARGLAFLQVPTTLLAMVDASVGGKVAVDHPQAKNMIGAFHQPHAVLCDLDVLGTLPEREFRCGLAEIVKHGVILDATLFEFIEQNVQPIADHAAAAIAHLVAQSCRIKAHVVEHDEFETTGLRSKLNYGHTFAHAFETADGYGSLRHGEAVAIGMICAAHLAEKVGRAPAEVNRRQLHLWPKLGLPTRIPDRLLNAPLIDTMLRDKKAHAGTLRFVLPHRIGHAELEAGIQRAHVEQVLAEVNGLSG